MAESNGNGNKVTYAAICGVILGAAAWGLSQKFTALEQRIDDATLQREKLDARLSDLIQRETERNNRIEREMGEIHATQDARTDVVRRLEEDIIRLWQITVRLDADLSTLRARLAALEATSSPDP